MNTTENADSTTAKPHLTAVPDTKPGRCTLHPAFDADYCPSCGTSARMTGWY